MKTWRKIYAWNTIRVIRFSAIPRQLIALLCVLLLTACASGALNNSPLQINGMLIENQTQMWVSAVRLLVPVTGNFVSCGNIAPESMCSTTFPEANYTGNKVEITWSQDGQIHSTGEFVLQLPADVDEELPASVYVVIAGAGSAGAYIVQN
jgi:hypothetical protein